MLMWPFLSPMWPLLSIPSTPGQLSSSTWPYPFLSLSLIPLSSPPHLFLPIPYPHFSTPAALSSSSSLFPPPSPITTSSPPPPSPPPLLLLISYSSSLFLRRHPHHFDEIRTRFFSLGAASKRRVGIGSGKKQRRIDLSGNQAATRTTTDPNRYRRNWICCCLRCCCVVSVLGAANPTSLRFPNPSPYQCQQHRNWICCCCRRCCSGRVVLRWRRRGMSGCLRQRRRGLVLLLASSRLLLGSKPWFFGRLIDNQTYGKRFVFDID